MSSLWTLTKTVLAIGAVAVLLAPALRELGFLPSERSRGGSGGVPPGAGTIGLNDESNPDAAAQPAGDGGEPYGSRH